MDRKESEFVDDEDLPDEDIIVAVCAGIVSIDEESNIIHLVHYTAQEFFELNRTNKFVNAQESITGACLSYLSQSPFQNGPCDDDIKLNRRLQNFPLLRYAAQNWGNHARGPPEQSCRDQLLVFLNNECLTACASQVYHAAFHHGFPRHIPSLVNASVFGLSEVVDFLLGMGSTIEETDNLGVSPLIGASQSGHDPTVRRLVDAGAQIEARTLYQSTALIEAASNGHEPVVELLLEKGASLEATDLHGSTALHRAAKKGYAGLSKYFSATEPTLW